MQENTDSLMSSETKSMNKMNTFTNRLKLLKKQMKILDMKNSVKEKE